MKRIGISIILALSMLLATVSPVMADTANPDPVPSIESLNIYHNLRQPGDWLAVIYANIPYGTPPSTPVTETFTWRLMDTDNVTELGSTVGTNYNADGYGYNVYSIYFDSANATALGLTAGWGTPYPLRLSGNPVVFDTPPVYNYVIDAGDYTSFTLQGDVQAELALRILVIAADLDSKWGLGAATTLLTQNETATVLSINGEAFFRGAIYGLQSMAPAVFSVVIRVLDIEDRVWGEEYSVNITSQYAGTWIETSQEAGKVLFGTTYDLLSVIMLLAMSIGLLIGNVMLTGNHWNGLMDVAIAGVIAARLGMYDLAFLMLAAFLCWVYVSAKIWFGVFR